MDAPVPESSRVGTDAAKEANQVRFETELEVRRPLLPRATAR